MGWIVRALGLTCRSNTCPVTTVTRCFLPCVQANLDKAVGTSYSKIVR